MIRGLTATVLTPVAGDPDRLGNPTVHEWTETAVDGVLVDPGTTADMEAARPEGATVALTLHFPKTWTASLRGCRVELPEPYAGTYRVVGDPKPYMGENCPTDWHMPVDVEVANG